MAGRVTEDHKRWLFDIAHGNLSETWILQGFTEYYARKGLSLDNVWADLVFNTSYGGIYIDQAMKDIKAVLEKSGHGM